MMAPDFSRDTEELERLLRSPWDGAPVNTTMPVREAPSIDRVPDQPAPSAGRVPVGSTFQGFTPRHAMEGFDFKREQNTGKSAKDAFAYLSNQAPPPPLHDKAALGAWFKQHIEPGMNALGHQVSNVEGDKFRFNNWQGQFDVDYGRGAGAEGGALAWQVDDGSAQMAQNPNFQQRFLDVMPMTGGANTAGLSSTGESLQDRLQAELDALIGGGASPMDQDALAQLLRI